MGMGIEMSGNCEWEWVVWLVDRWKWAWEWIYRNGKEREHHSKSSPLVAAATWKLKTSRFKKILNVTGPLWSTARAKFSVSRKSERSSDITEIFRKHGFTDISFVDWRCLLDSPDRIICFAILKCSEETETTSAVSLFAANFALDFAKKKLSSPLALMLHKDDSIYVVKCDRVLCDQGCICPIFTRGSEFRLAMTDRATT